MKTDLNLTQEKRKELLGYLLPELEHYYVHTESLKVTPDLDLEKVIESVRSQNLDSPTGDLEALKSVLSGMKKHTVHTPHPMYFGLYNPRSNFAGILADLITAVFNPQLAAWSHSPYASEVEKYMVEYLGIRFGYEKEKVDGVFAGGGAEANFTAILCALNHSFPEAGKKGLVGLKKQPVIYCSAETHHSIVKGAGMAGLGRTAVCQVPVDRQLRMNTEELEKMIREDLETDRHPMMLVATAGTTGTGTIDPIKECAEICRKYGIWYHVDAAYGGACIMDEKLSPWLDGIEESDSLIVDLHKWFSVPMAASLFLTRDPDILHRTFSIRTDYMPGDARDLEITDPFTHSFQWSRRFTGLKIYLSLLMFGTEGYARVFREQVETGNLLREYLKKAGWKIMNDSPLPVICFTDESLQNDPGFARAVCDEIVRSGDAWVSVYPVHQVLTLRACITNYETGKEHIAKLVELLGKARTGYQSLHHIFVITGGVQGGKTTFLTGLIHQLRKKQFSMAGFISEGAFIGNKRSAFTLVSVENGESHDLASVEEKEGWIRFGRFYFNPEALEVGKSIIRSGLERKVDIVVLDEVGPFELSGGVWSDLLDQLGQNHEIAQIWVAREQILNEVLKRWNIPEERVTRIGEGNEEKFIKKIAAYVRNDEIGPAT